MAPIDIILGLALWTKGLPPSLNELKEATLALGTSTLRERAAWSATSADFPLHLGSQFYQGYQSFQGFQGLQGGQGYPGSQQIF